MQTGKGGIVKRDTPTKFVSQTELAEILGVSQPMVSKYLAQGKIPESCIVQEGRYKKLKCDEAIEALRANLDPGRTKLNKGADIETVDEAGIDQDISFAEAQRLEKSYAAALKKLEYEEKIGKLISADEVREAVFTKARTVRDAILNIPDRISATIAVESDQIAVSKLLMDELVQALEDLCQA